MASLLFNSPNKIEEIPPMQIVVDARAAEGWLALFWSRF